MNRKTVIISNLVTYPIISVICGFAYNWFKKARLDYQNSHGSNIYQRFPLMEDLKLGFLLGATLYVFYLIAWAISRRNVWLQSILTGGLVYGTTYFLIGYTTFHGRDFWMAPLPMVAVGLILPFVHRAVAALVSRSSS